MKFNRDKMNNADPAKVAKATVAVISRLQDFPPHEQVTASAAMLLTLAEQYKVSAQDIFTVTKNLMNSKEGLRPEFGAVRDYVQHELVNPK